MICSIENKILVVYIIKLIRKVNYLNNRPYSAEHIHKKLCELNIKPRPPKKSIKFIVKLLGDVKKNIC